MKGRFAKKNEMTRKERQKQRDSNFKSTILREKARAYDHAIYTQDLEDAAMEEDHHLLMEKAEEEQYRTYCWILFNRERQRMEMERKMVAK